MSERYYLSIVSFCRAKIGRSIVFESLLLRNKPPVPVVSFVCDSIGILANLLCYFLLLSLLYYIVVGCVMIFCFFTKTRKFLIYPILYRLWRLYISVQCTVELSWTIYIYVGFYVCFNALYRPNIAESMVDSAQMHLFLIPFFRNNRVTEQQRRCFLYSFVANPTN